MSWLRKRSEIEIFLDSGTFLDTKAGPRFVQDGKVYRVRIHDEWVRMRVKAEYRMSGEPVVMLTPVDPDEFRGPAGPSIIEDVLTP